MGCDIKSTGHFTQIQIAVIVDGLAIEQQQTILKQRPDIVVSTPERLGDLLEDDELPLKEEVSTLDFLVIDGTDKMIEQKDSLQLRQLFKQVIPNLFWTIAPFRREQKFHRSPSLFFYFNNWPRKHPQSIIVNYL